MSQPAYCIPEQISDDITGVTLCFSESCFFKSNDEFIYKNDPNSFNFDEILTRILKYDGPITLLKI
ncbi:MAG: hypothetical protein EAX86_05210 [Candidatus Heimdallarchaeota archaeon]|nr:hypothetical protein [Candidatus Heimdallarchaeota archaeon]